MSIRKAVFPVAGLGTRFLPATKCFPKEMLPLVDRPVIQWAVEEAVASGLAEMILVTSRGKGLIEDHFRAHRELEKVLEGKGKKLELDSIKRTAELARFTTVVQHEALGLGHAVLTARELVGDEPFAVLLCDDVMVSEVPCVEQLARVYAERQASVLCVEEVRPDQVSSYGIVAGEKVAPNLWRVTDLVEKPSPAEAPSNLGIVGRYVLTPGIFAELERTPRGRGGEIQLTDGLKSLLAREPVYAHAFAGKRYDVGTKLGFVEATIGCALADPEFGPQVRRYLKTLDL